MIGRWGGLLGAVAAVMAGAASPDAETPSVSLFDGRTLDGWVAEHTDRFSVRDGVIFGDGGTGWLRSARAYRNFEFRAEYRALGAGADSGLLFRAGARSAGTAQHWPAKAYQLQVADAPNNLMIFGHGAPSRADRNAEALRRAMKGPGQWQRVTLRVVGSRAEASLNGTLVTVSDAISLPEGHLGIQGENGQFEWRDLQIKELPAP